jgi:hypothetical protein
VRHGGCATDEQRGQARLDDLANHALLQRAKTAGREQRTNLKATQRMTREQGDRPCTNRREIGNLVRIGCDSFDPTQSSPAMQGFRHGRRELARHGHERGFGQGRLVANAVSGGRVRAVLRDAEYRLPAALCEDEASAASPKASRE